MYLILMLHVLHIVFINSNVTAKKHSCTKLSETSHQSFPANIVLNSLLSTLNILGTFSSVSIAYFQQVNVCWVY